MGTYFAKWIQSYRDLPLLVNQWANVVRWELRPRLFLRTTEFLWQEGHTCHATQEEARDFAVRILHEVYADCMEQVLAVPVYRGRKTAAERFAGAINTMACEAMMRDGKALQMGTSHELGQNFAKAFGIEYLSAEGNQENVWQTSWGTSTRMVGGLIMTHGDDNGLRVPPVLAPIQVVVLVVRDEEGAGEAAARLADELKAAGVRVRLDDKVETSFGRRATSWELKGIPVRVEVGPRDLKEGEVTVVRRDNGEKRQVAVTGVAGEVAGLLATIQADLLAEATKDRDDRTLDVTSIEDVADAAVDGFVRIPWDAVGLEGEARLANDALTVRCLQRADGSLPEADDEPDLIALVARSY
ncbi:MAG TPA: His/Gly/Thr/Pro-type tRNA ligase C-terminal domain-containing protein, partial [Acidimicrobiales bacterium]